MDNMVDNASLFDQAVEPETVPEGVYTLRIEDVPELFTNDTSGNQSIMLNLVIEGHDNAWPIRHFLPFLSDEDIATFGSADRKSKEWKSVNFKITLLKRFFKCFNMEEGLRLPSRWTEWPGHQGGASVGVGTMKKSDTKVNQVEKFH